MRVTRILAGMALAMVLSGGSALLLHGQQKSVSLEGYVLDSACAFTKNLEKPISRECAVQCAKAGSPLVILTNDGTIYWPIAETIPASGQNAKLMQYAGERVTVKGRVYERGGSHALVIEEIASGVGKK